MSYFNKIKSSKEAVIKELELYGVDKNYLTFGGEGPPPKRITTPTDARSEFLANRAMGDWAENTLTDAISKAAKVLHYGDTDPLAAGEDGFKEFYAAKLEDVRLYGKRPDLLVFDAHENVSDDDVRNKTTRELLPLVQKARYAIEVRSSKYEALKYIDVRRQEKLDGKKPVQDTPNFTVKVEDLKIVYRWLEHHNCPQIYCQVFFDSIFAINFTEIFSIIGQGKGKGKDKRFSIENPKKSQEKSTIMIPITSGHQIATCDLPEFTVEHRVTKLGRHDAFVKPIGGTVYLDAEKLKAVALSE